MHASRSLQAGFTYIGLLVTVVIIGVMLTMVSRVWSVAEQRERETQLLFAGDQIRAAIGSYHASGRQYPLSLDDLLDDKRSPIPRRHLRRLYFDPMTGTTDWTLVLAPTGGIMGVASKSKLTPIKRTGFTPEDASFEASDCYCTWEFVYLPRFYRRLPAVNPGKGQ